MKRVINVRPLFIALLGLTFGILAYALTILSEGLINFSAGILFFALIFISAIIFAFSFIKIKVFEKLKQKRIIIAVFAIFGLIGTLSMFLNSMYFTSFKTYSGEYTIVGEINDDYYVKNGYTFITLSNVHVSNGEIEEKLPANLSVVVYRNDIVDDSMVSAKNYMTFTGQILKNDFKNIDYNFNSYINNVPYYSETNNATFTSGSFTVSEFIKNKYKTILENLLSNDNAQITYSLLFGNDEVLKESTMQLFSTTGVVHVISVSGLHVAVLVAVLTLLLKLLKVKRNYQLIIIAIILALYSYLCGFVPSVIRSSIMSLVFLWSINLGERYDGLSALSLSGLILLMFTPLNLFSVGFQLSFVAMFALITIAPLFTRVLNKYLKLPNSISITLSMTICATLLTFPIIAKYFNTFSLYGVLGNLLAVPLMSVAFVVSFGIITFAIFVPFLSYLLILPNMLIHFSKVILEVIAALPLSQIKMFSDGYLSLALLLGFAFFVKYVMINSYVKTTLASAMLVGVLIISIVFNLPVKYYSNSVFFEHQRESLVALYTLSNGETVLMGSNFSNEAYFEKLINETKINEITYIVSYDYSYKQNEFLVNTYKKFNVKTLILPKSFENNATVENNFATLNLEFVNDNVKYNINENLTFTFIYDVDEFLAVDVEFNDSFILIIKPKLNSANLTKLGFAINKEYDYVFVSGVSQNLNNYEIVSQNIITTSKNNTENVNIFDIRQLKHVKLDV